MKLPLQPRCEGRVFREGQPSVGWPYVAAPTPHCLEYVEGERKESLSILLHRPSLLPIGLLPKEVFVATALHKMFLQPLALGG